MHIASNGGDYRICILLQKQNENSNEKEADKATINLGEIWKIAARTQRAHEGGSCKIM